MAKKIPPKPTKAHKGQEWVLEDNQWQSKPKGTSAKTDPVPAAPKPATPQDLIDKSVKGIEESGGRARDLGREAIDFTTGSPVVKNVEGFTDDILSGDINRARNPFLQDIYNETQGVNPNEAMDLLRSFIGGVSPGGSSRVQPGSNVRSRPSSSGSSVGGIGGVSGSGGGGAGGGAVPDTVGGANTFFAQKIKELFDPAVLDPANDPTMQPFIEAIRRENQENLLSSLTDITARAEEQGAYGSGLYQAQAGRAREEGIESLDQAIAGAMMGSRESALSRRMQGLGLTNTRDLAAMQDQTQRYGIDSASAAAGAGSAAAAADAEKSRQLQAIGMLLSGQQGVLGLRGDMAGLMSGNQQGAGQLGLGVGQLGLGGYNLGMQGEGIAQGGYGDIGQLGMGQLNAQLQKQIADAQNKIAQGGLSVQRGHLGLAQDQAMQGSLNDLLNIMLGIGGMGFTGDSTNTTPGQFIPGGPDPALAAILAGLGSYAGSQQNQQQGQVINK